MEQLAREVETLRASLARIPSRVALIVFFGVAVNLAIQIVIRFVFGPYAFPHYSPPAPPAGNSNSVRIGSALPDAPESRRVYLTTAEVAAAESIAERTVLDRIAEGRILATKSRTP